MVYFFIRTILLENETHFSENLRTKFNPSFGRRTKSQIFSLRTNICS